MYSGRGGNLGIAAAALSLLVATASAAQADNVFDMLFGSGNRATSSARGAHQSAPEPRSRKPVSLPRISAPTFYTYRPDDLVHVDFDGIEPPAAQAAFEPALAGAAFREALPGLAGYELFAEKEIAEALARHYSNNPDFIWVSGHQANARAERALRVLAEADRYGLLQADYAVTVPALRFSYDALAERQQALIRFEMALSARALRYARDAYLGRVDPNRLSGFHDLPKKPFDAAQSLAFMANASDVGLYLEGLHPRGGEYRALMAELETLRAAAEREIAVDPRTFVRPGGTHPDFANILRLIERDGNAALLETHGALLRSHAGSTVYDEELVPVIKAAQSMHDLRPDGIVGPRTVAAIAGESKSARIAKVLYALERLRWLPSDLGDTRVVVNAAAFEVDYFEDGRPKLNMRTVVGTPVNQTSFFYDTLAYVEFNPYWGVPRSIIVNEMLPKLFADPSYLDRNGYEVIDGRGRKVSSTAVDWGGYGTSIPFGVRQKPGRGNALGELKILFPNRHNIYMHDTPSKGLFERDTRAYSHGCIRLADPRAMAAAVLDISLEEVAASIGSGSGQPTRRDIRREIPVYVAYFTAWPRAAGKIGYHDDVYGRDERLKTALDKVADLRSPSS